MSNNSTRTERRVILFRGCSGSSSRGEEENEEEKGNNNTFVADLQQNLLSSCTIDSLPLMLNTWKNSKKLLNILTMEVEEEEEEQEGKEHWDFLFTSQRAVQAMSLLWHSLQDESTKAAIISKYKNSIAFCVGVSTGKAVRELLNPVLDLRILGEECGYGEDLGQLIVRHFKENWNDDANLKRKLLFLNTPNRRDILPRILSENSIEFKELAVYETTPVGDILARLEADFAVNGVPSAIIFFAPSVVRAFLTQLLAAHADSTRCHREFPHLLTLFARFCNCHETALNADTKNQPPLVFAIGSTTAAEFHLPEYDIPFPEKPTAPSLAKCVQEKIIIEESN